jgi:hypothetical protein
MGTISHRFALNKGGTGTAVLPRRYGFPSQNDFVNQKGFPSQDDFLKRDGFPNQDDFLNRDGFPNQNDFLNQKGFLSQDGFQNQKGFLSQNGFQNQNGFRNQKGFLSQDGFPNQNGSLNQKGFLNQNGLLNQNGFLCQKSNIHKELLETWGIALQVDFAVWAARRGFSQAYPGQGMLHQGHDTSLPKAPLLSLDRAVPSERWRPLALRLRILPMFVSSMSLIL